MRQDKKLDIRDSISIKRGLLTPFFKYKCNKCNVRGIGYWFINSTKPITNITLHISSLRPVLIYLNINHENFIYALFVTALSIRIRCCSYNFELGFSYLKYRILC